MQDTPDNSLKLRQTLRWISRSIQLHGKEARQQVEQKDDKIAKRKFHSFSCLGETRPLLRIVGGIRSSAGIGCSVTV